MIFEDGIRQQNSHLNIQYDNYRDGKSYASNHYGKIKTDCPDDCRKNYLEI